MSKHLSLTKVLKHQPKHLDKDKLEGEIKAFQLRMLKIQQGVWHNKSKVIILFEGFDAAGKGGAIRTITEVLDPRGVRVHPIGPPSEEEKQIHWQYRFWRDLPSPGTIAIFDRSWYGRVLVERVEGLTPKHRWQEAYAEINDLEKVLQREGFVIIKIFLAITRDEQLKRFEERLHDPYKQWKITKEDIEARKKWDAYVDAADELLKRTDTEECPWHVIPADSKRSARRETLQVVTTYLHSSERWMDSEAAKLGKRKLEKSLRKDLA